jgi:hypothetical protein
MWRDVLRKAVACEGLPDDDDDDDDDDDNVDDVCRV